MDKAILRLHEMNDAVNRLILSLNEAKRDRDKYRAVLTKIDAECQKHGGIMPMGERWERNKTLAHEVIPDPSVIDQSSEVRRRAEGEGNGT